MKRDALMIFCTNIRFILVLILFNTLPFCLLISQADSINQDKKHILVIHSYEETLLSYADYNKMLRENLNKAGMDADIQFSYLDCESVWDDEEHERMADIVRSSRRRPDIILTTGDQATYCLMVCKNPEVKTIPVVFTGVNFPNWEVLKKNPNVTGIWDHPDYVKNLQLIKQVMGDKHIRFFYDRTFLGWQIIERLSEQFKEDKELNTYLARFLEKKDSVIMKSEFEEKSLDRDGNSLSDDLFFMNMRDEKGKELLWNISGIGLYRNSAFLLPRYDYTVAQIGLWASEPVFSATNKLIGYGANILGGYITTLEDEVNEGCQYVIRVLKGEEISQLPVKEAPKKFILDWEALKKWNISIDNLPAEYEIINIPLLVKYRTLAILVLVVVPAIVIALFCYLLFLYVRESKRKKQAQLNLMEEKKFLSLAMEGGNIFAWRYDSSENTFMFDKEFIDSVNLKSTKIKLEELIQMTHLDDVESVIDKFIRVVNKLEDKAIIRTQLNFNGTGYVWYEFRVLNISGILADKSSVIGTVMNIQNFKDREDELIMAKDIAAKMELKQSFLANMSHEIRTPLNAIVGFSGLLVYDHEIPEEEKHEFIVSINKNCELLLKLVDDILEISRIESGSMSFTFEPYSLNELIDDIYRTHQLMIPGSVEFIKKELTDDLSLNIDVSRFKQVISNLVNNAIKFTSEGYIRIGAEYNKKTKEVCIYVEDSGTGIPPEEQKMIFERFYKRNEFAQGTGLGLSISQVIVEKLKGRIMLSSEVGKGSRFEVVIPYSEEGEEAVMEIATESLDFKNLVDDMRPTVLIAEDSVSNYMVLNSILKRKCSILWAVNGKDAVNLVSKHHVDLILMDIKMQEMDGITALRKIRKKFKNLPVIIQTAYSSQENRKMAVEAGASGFIAKPVMVDELMELVEKLIPIER